MIKKFPLTLLSSILKLPVDLSVREWKAMVIIACSFALVSSVGTFLLSPHQNIRKTFEIVPEKIKKSSIQILQILVLSKYN